MTTEEIQEVTRYRYNREDYGTREEAENAKAYDDAGRPYDNLIGTQWRYSGVVGWFSLVVPSRKEIVLNKGEAGGEGCIEVPWDMFFASAVQVQRKVEYVEVAK